MQLRGMSAKSTRRKRISELLPPRAADCAGF